VSGEDPLARPVHVAGVDKPFGEVTEADARAMAAELRAAGSWGPLARVAAIARGWAQLADALRDAGAPTVAALDAETVRSTAERLWIIPPEQPLF
jgi:hypothetical protein